MKALVIYFSKFGNTHQVAAAIANTLEKSMSVELLHYSQLDANGLTDVDLVIMGAPTHKMNLPETVKPWIEALPKRIFKGRAVAAFDTSYKMSWWLNHFTAGKRLDQRLHRLGGKRVISPEIFHVTGREGPLYEGEIERARDWARMIVDRVQARNPTSHRAIQGV